VPTTITGGDVHTGRRVLRPGWVTLEHGRVVDLGAGSPGGIAGELVDASGHAVVPGFVDVHCHGGGGAQITDAPLAVVAAHREHGTTGMVASLVSAPLEVMERQVAMLAELVDEGVLCGIHLEGPWLSPRFCGAHDPDVLLDPAPDAVERLMRAGRGTIAVVTLAPELPGADDAARRILGHGARVAVGHTAADHARTLAAIAAGASLATHLHNAMPTVHHRAPGPALALLDAPGVAVELIADGEHLHPATLHHAARAAGPERTVLVSDATAGAAAPDGRYELGGLDIDVRAGRAELASGALAGSTLTLEGAVRHAVHDAGLSFEAALAAVTTVPAGLLGRPDRGHLEVGATGGAVVLDRDLRVARVVS
jgi:N-acetylglucosamine-6-phosphate deacetylase